MNRLLSDFLSTVCSAWSEALPSVPPDEEEQALLWRYAKAAHLETFFYYGYAKLGLSATEEQNALYMQNIRKDVVQEEALSELCRAFSDKGLKVMPLKGCLLKPLYPSPEMRYMGDLDLLYQGEDAAVKEVMSSLGYELEQWNTENVHSSFRRDGLLLIELHHRLLRAGSGMEGSLLGVWERAEPNPDCPGYYRMSPADQYLFMTAHTVKHIYNGGSGLRSFLDIAVFLRAYPEIRGDESVRAGLRESGLALFEERAAALSQKLFPLGGEAREPLTEEEEEIVLHILFSGTYGTLGGRIAGHSQSNWKSSRFRYILNRIFPPLRQLAVSYTLFGRHSRNPLLYPLYWCKRFCMLLFRSRGKIRQEAKAVSSFRSEDFHAFANERRYFGLPLDTEREGKAHV